MLRRTCAEATLGKCTMLTVKSFYAEIGGKPIFKGLNLGPTAGEVRAIVWPNGAGKSMLSGTERRR